MKRLPSFCAGFNLIELVIIVALLLGLSILAVPVVEITDVRTREKRLRETLRETRYAIDRYRSERKPDPMGIVPLYPPSIASLLQPIPAHLLKIRGDSGPFLANIPQNPFVAEKSAFFWDIRDSVSGTDTWTVSVSSAARQFTNGVYDIRFPINNMGMGIGALDGSTYDNW